MLVFQSLSHLLENPPPPIQWLWEGMIPERSMVLAHSGSKQGKSMLSLNVALLGAKGGASFLGTSLREQPFTTVILQNEIHVRGIYDRADKMITQMALRAGGFAPEHLNRILINSERSQKLSVDETFQEFHELLRFVKPDLVVLDPLAHVLTEDENSNTIVGKVLQNIAIWRDDPGCSILLIHHDAKVNENTFNRSPQQRARGADRLNADPDVIISMQPQTRQAVGPASKIHIASRYGQGCEPFNIRLNENTLWFERFIEKGSSEEIASWVEQLGSATEQMLIEKMQDEWGLGDEKQNRAAKNHLKIAVNQGFLIEEDGVYTVPERGEQK